MIDAALVLEGGSLRSLYTQGILDIFIRERIEFSCVISVSAGALAAANYISKQEGRSARINIMHSRDSKYYGIKQLLFKKSAFNFDYLLGSPIAELYPFDHETYNNTKQRYIVTATDCMTGNPVYFEKPTYNDLAPALIASSSMPLISPIISIDGYQCLDGGISEPVGIDKAIKEGYKKIVIIQTRNRGYRKKKTSVIMSFLYKINYRKYPMLLEKLLNMSENYNALLKRIDEMADNSEIFVIQPQNPVKVKRIEKNMMKLAELYLHGRDDGRKLLNSLIDYLSIN